MTSNECYVDQSTASIIRDVTYVYRRVSESSSWMYEYRRSKKGSSKGIVDEYKYLKLNCAQVTQWSPKYALRMDSTNPYLNDRLTLTHWEKRKCEN